MSKGQQFILTSERNLLSMHITIATRIKSFKKLFIKKGLMMKIFEQICWLHQTQNYECISDMVVQLYSVTPYHWEPRHGKYKELIEYCLFLEKYKIRDSEEEGYHLARDLFDRLNLGHELGRAIKKYVQAMFK